jgi:hypothetical protein
MLNSLPPLIFPPHGRGRTDGFKMIFIIGSENNLKMKNKHSYSSPSYPVSWAKPGRVRTHRTNPELNVC